MHAENNEDDYEKMYSKYISLVKDILKEIRFKIYSSYRALDIYFSS